MVPVRLLGPRLAIREYRHTEGDVDALHALFGDPEVTRYLPFGPSDRETCADQIELYLEEAMAEQRDTYRLAVTRRAEADTDAHAEAEADTCPDPYDCADDPQDATPIAHASLTLGEFRSASLGYVLRRDVWGRGYAGEIVGLLCDFAFRTLDLHRLAARVDVDNTASARVLTRLGFRLEGRERHDRFKAGVWSDSYRYSLLADEWPGAAADRRRAGEGG
ncbi:GNAT family N-acetyltransferase [Streptomyces sp. 1331.2]|uniref:GNAT family N-acetyltransferase n=1 Tax=Streptomyces sp. 1331.2 TaxID=1938835 RepID=UPI000BD68292|nr:GNAT family protein [Streptomyces sp. 1331.2]SOB82686.1 Protein N-acetyltransferase, RimJ/RimL family [Streptomyces sp. 1331.2]